MRAPVPPTFEVHLDADWASRALLADVRRGLARLPRSLPPRWLYDARGSRLFDEITRLPEYYPTERERQILRERAAEIVSTAGADTLIELGSGTSDKTRVLLDALYAGGGLHRFVALDVSATTLREAAEGLAIRYPGLAVHGIVGDFTLHLGELPRGGRRMVAFLGGTIGNFYEEERRAFLGALADTLEPGDSLLLGVDLVKPVDRIIAAYDDAEGVTAEFTRNGLAVINRELDADFDLEAFDYVPLWDPRQERMDLRLRADGDQQVRIPGVDLALDLHDGEEIRMEISTKFRRVGISLELEQAGFGVTRFWTDPNGDFALILATRR